MAITIIVSSVHRLEPGQPRKLTVRPANASPPPRLHLKTPSSSVLHWLHASNFLTAPPLTIWNTITMTSRWRSIFFLFFFKPFSLTVNLRMSINLQTDTYKFGTGTPASAAPDMLRHCRLKPQLWNAEIPLQWNRQYTWYSTKRN